MMRLRADVAGRLEIPPFLFTMPRAMEQVRMIEFDGEITSRMLCSLEARIEDDIRCCSGGFVM